VTTTTSVSASGVVTVDDCFYDITTRVKRVWERREKERRKKKKKKPVILPKETAACLFHFDAPIYLHAVRHEG
jgi:hypothetical protein